ncbi:hypothetical protein [Ammoniphilus sp. CFH 90114]|uniref:hypothetical protein n=1 Tax=Ammoniphilus sp. CFH 90114 TaxID=2493665 RepID=UPI00100F090F|nr:hypothetical protein [Ammoniphilus sp. CFH 90114]RXT08753.1 hypothetical protein EIZ39_08060 [Ammoniphilus sp. CFH 90114]
MPVSYTREEIYESYSISELYAKRKDLIEALNVNKLSEYETIEVHNLISVINQRIQLMNELLGVS